jgi:hypothetical protein
MSGDITPAEGASKKIFEGDVFQFVNRISFNGALNSQEIEDAVGKIAADINITEQFPHFSNEVGAILHQAHLFPVAAECFKLALLQQEIDNPQDQNLPIYAANYINTMNDHLNRLGNFQAPEQISQNFRWFMSQWEVYCKANVYLETREENQDMERAVKNTMLGLVKLITDRGLLK